MGERILGMDLVKVRFLLAARYNGMVANILVTIVVMNTMRFVSLCGSAWQAALLMGVLAGSIPARLKKQTDAGVVEWHIQQIQNLPNESSCEFESRRRYKYGIIKDLR